MMSLTIKGDDKINAMLDGLGTKLSRSVVRGGMRKLAQVVAEEAKDRVKSGGKPRRSTDGRVRVHADDVRSSIKVKSSVLANGTITSSVYTSGKGSGLAVWLEFGTGAHLISVTDADRPTATNRRGGVRQWSIKQINKSVKRGSLVIGDKFVGPVVSHPGATPHPFLRPAVDAKVEAGVQAMADYIRGRLERAGVNAPPEPEGDEE